MMLPCEPGPPKRLWSTIGCFGLILGCAGSSVIAPAQQATASLPAAQPPLFTFTVTSREVLLDVVATDDAGRPVTGLTSADFTVKEEDAPQTLLSLSEQRGMSPAQQLKAPAQQLKAPALPPNTFTNATPVENTQARTVVLLDAQDTPMPAQMFAREELIGYLKHIQPGAQIAIFSSAYSFVWYRDSPRTKAICWRQRRASATCRLFDGLCALRRPPRCPQHAQPLPGGVPGTEELDPVHSPAQAVASF